MQEFLERLDRLEAEKYREALQGDETPTLQVQVVSAQALNSETQAAIETQTQKLLEREIEVRYRIDPGLIAGATMRFAGTVIDGSLSGQLQMLNERYQADSEREAA
jgi:ATP synthase F1 delta subunit